MIVTNETLILAEEVILAAMAEHKELDFEADSMLRPLRAGRGHEDRMRMLKMLQAQGAISNSEGVLILNRSDVPDWIRGASKLGFEKGFVLANHFISSEGAALKFEFQLLAEIGLDGERAWISLLESGVRGSANITHVSLFDDSAGYDIRADFDDGTSRFFEVKTSSRPAHRTFDFFVSRNEASKANSLTGWELVCIHIESGVAKYVGSLDWTHFKPSLPTDKSDSIQWSTVRAKIPLLALLDLNSATSG
jgi:hypothetical protein